MRDLIGKSVNKEEKISVLACEAHRQALLKFKEIRSHYATKPQALQYGGWKTHENPSRFYIIQKAPTIENMVLKGGGAKGIGYLGALKAMEEYGFLKDVREFAGTSAGALTATLLAFGCSTDEIKEILEKHPMEELIGRSDKMESLLFEPRGMGKIKAISDKMKGLSGQPLIGTKSATAIVEIFNEVIRARVSGFLSELDSDLVELQLPENGKEKIEEMKKTDHLFTFADLAILHNLAPDKFKNLTLTAYDIKNKEKCFLNYNNYPQLPIALAARMSMSIPFYFAPIGINYGGKERLMVDGGVTSNVPAEVFLEDKKDPLTFAKTAVFTFDENGHAYARLHALDPQQEKPKATTIQEIKAKMSGNPDYLEDSWEDKKKEHQSGPNTMVVFHGGLGTFSFSAKEKKVEAAERQAELAMLEQMYLRMNQGVIQQFDTIEALVSSMDKKTLHLILDQGKPNSEDYKEGVDSVNYKMACEVFDGIIHLITQENPLITSKFSEDGFVFNQSEFDQLLHKAEQHRDKI
jgi:predicted acylesterase/phospholipase RssA